MSKHLDSFLKPDETEDISVDLQVALSMKDNLIKNLLTASFKRSFVVQNILGSYIDARLSTTSTDFDPLNFKTIEDQKKLLLDAVGWFPNKKNISYKPTALDEIALLQAYCLIAANPQSSPGEVSLNSLRLNDILQLIKGKNFFEGKKYPYDYEPISSNLYRLERVQLNYIRYKYFTFIAHELALFFETPDREALFALLLPTFNTYQLIIAISVAFSAYERRLVIMDTKIAYPVLEISDWSIATTFDLLSDTGIQDTVEWLKWAPLLKEEDILSNHKLLDLKLRMPSELTDDDNIILRDIPYLSFANLRNHSIIEYKSTVKERFLDLIPFTDRQDEHESQLDIDFSVTIQGYYLALMNNKRPEMTMLGIFEDIITPLYSDIFNGLISDTSRSTLLPMSLFTKEILVRSLTHVVNVAQSKLKELVLPLLDLSSRIIHLKRKSSYQTQSPLYFDTISSFDFS